MRYLQDFLAFVYRILLVYLLFMFCRVVFYVYNADLLGAISWAEFPRLLQGSLIYDSGSVFYINLPFLFFSLLPFRFREKGWYGKSLIWIFVVVNSLGLAVNIADIFYYPYKLARIASDDLHFVSNGNFGALMGSFMKDFWWGFLLLGGMVFVLWKGFKLTAPRKYSPVNGFIYYPLQVLLLAFSAVFAVVMIRGGNMSKATFPINVSDASLYASPSKTGLVVSNPFSLIRTLGRSVTYPVYFPEAELLKIFDPVHVPDQADSARVKLEEQPNVMLIILESISSAHIKSLSDQFAEDAPGYTPFLDSLISEGFIFRNAYHNGKRSIDALPALWASIPTFSTQFLALPQSSAPMYPLPQIMKDMGYNTAFMHGAVKESMSFVAFGKKCGVDIFVSQEEYEQAHGKGDFDGKWGIWDHKFFPFAAENLDVLPKPFFTTMFTLSSHHPFQLPKGLEGEFPEGSLPIHKMISYSDNALREFFAEISRYEWFGNTLFIITADHGSGADNEKYLRVPYSYAVPLLFYSPSGTLRGESSRVAGHVDLMPTLLGMIGYDKPYFAFGNDLFDPDSKRFTMNYMGAYNAISDSLVYMFDGRGFVGAYNYIKDPLQQHNFAGGLSGDDPFAGYAKAFIQQYYGHIKERDFLAE